MFLALSVVFLYFSYKFSPVFLLPCFVALYSSMKK